MVVFVLSLGIDTLMMSIALGFYRTSGKIRIATTFASAEVIMALVGLFIGKGLGTFIGNWASLTGGILLLGVAVWLLVFDNDDEEKNRFEHDLVGWTLILTAISISLDELAMGFSIGLIGIPVTLTVILIACQAFVFTVVGLTFGSKLKPYLGEWSEKLAGTILGLLALWLIFIAILHLLHH